MEERNKEIDIVRGILIFCVVFAHYEQDLVHDIIFLFHMPLFFILSGFLLKEEKVTDLSYIKSKAISMLTPYICYLLLDWFLIRGDFSLNGFAHMFWGGRAISGTYWYMTCFIIALSLFGFLFKYFKNKTVKVLVISGGGIAILESHLSEYIHLLESPGIPWNADVALLAVVYLALGFYNKKQIKELLNSNHKKYDVAALLVTVILVAFCLFNYWGSRRLYYFDMKPLYYKELISAMVIPCAFDIVLCRIVYWMDRCNGMNFVENVFAFLGRMTIPIMFMHVPLNTWKDELGYGRMVYLLIGIGVPVVFTAAFGRFKTMRKFFGLPGELLCTKDDKYL